MASEVELLGCFVERASKPVSVVEADDLVVGDPTPHVLGDPGASTAQLAGAVGMGRLPSKERSNASIVGAELRQREPQGVRRAAGECTEDHCYVVAGLDTEVGSGPVGGQAVGDLEPP
ncbi:hypothetical protein [Nocardioides lacusdianchii]|uniref:hypothetical protein n=1 Tax=Nocardioides lacusdianchii TaxID=2783664 RepID=UPI001F3C4F1B|nr:hypothetical protein [Nocardioides lacusdianchii]